LLAICSSKANSYHFFFSKMFFKSWSWLLEGLDTHKP